MAYHAADDKTPNYYSYLLRFWRDGEETAWRAMLEDPHTGQALRFSSIAQLCQFLQERTQVGPPPGEGGLHVTGATLP